MMPAEAPERPCVGSGMCCKASPCPYGERVPETGWCAFLVPWADSGTEHPRYRCGKFEEISKQPDAWLVPAFGAGCCSPLGNSARRAILIELRRKTS